MKSGQNHLVAFTAVEEMASQLWQQNVFKAPNQSLIQFLSILPESEYENEKRTFCNGFQSNREQVLMAIRFRFENLQCQRARRVEEGRTPVMLSSWPTLEEGLAGNIFPRQAPDVEEREGVKNKTMARMIGKRRLAAGLVAPRLTEKRGATQNLSLAARRGKNPATALIRYEACVVVEAIRLRSAPTLSLF